MKILKSKTFIGLCFGFLVLPFLINFLSCFQAPFESWEQPSQWTQFWGQYLSGFVAFAMLYVAWRTLLTTKESNRPYLIIDIADRGNSHAFLRCRNIGHTTATNISIKIPEEFINKIEIESVRNVLNEINNSNPFVLEPNGKKVWDLFCIPSLWLQLHEGGYGGSDFKHRGISTPKSEWENNEQLFKDNPFQCKVIYNMEYEEIMNIDYNNIADDITPDKRIADTIFSGVMAISKIEWMLSEKLKNNNGTEQTK